MKYFHYDGEKVLGIYDPRIHDSIPTPNVQVSDTDWQKYLDDQAAYKIIDGKLTYSPTVISPADLRDQRLVALDAEYDSQRLTLERYLTRAINYWQDMEIAAEIRTEMDALESEYAGKEAEIWNDYVAAVGD